MLRKSLTSVAPDLDSTSELAELGGGAFVSVSPNPAPASKLLEQGGCVWRTARLVLGTLLVSVAQ